MRGESSSDAVRRRHRLDLPCAYCERRFSKVEHRSRHERSHTGDTPFACTTCSKRFSRQDTLQRHIRQFHASESASAVPTEATEPVDHPQRISPVHDLAYRYCPDPPEVVTSQTIEGTWLPSIVQPATSQVGSGEPASLPTPIIDTSNEALDIWELLTSDLLPGSQNYAASEFWEILGFPPGSFPPGDLEQPVLDASRTTLPNGSRANSPERTRIDNGDVTISEVRNLVSGLSSRVTSAVKYLSSDWLNRCLNLFWTRFIPSFPVLHRPTFDMRETCAPLLLNMIAIGSLCLPGVEDGQRGVALWRLVHKSVAGSWDHLLELTGPHGAPKGTQLVLIAVIGQIFALMSAHRDLGDTAVIFHGLGINWARLAGLIASLSNPDHTTNDASLSGGQRWRHWAGVETARRAVLAHYILDGVIVATFPAAVPSLRHSFNPLTPVSTDTLFRCDSVSSWLTEYSKQPNEGHLPLSEVERLLWQREIQALPIQSSLSLQVVLEALFGAIVEWENAPPSSIGLTDLTMSAEGLCDFYHACLDPGTSFSPPAHLLARWHAVCIRLCIVSRSLSLARTDSPTSDRNHGVFFERAILHSMAILSIAQQLPLAAPVFPHISLPSSLHTAGLTLKAYLSSTPSKGSSSRRHSSAPAWWQSSSFDSIWAVDWFALGTTGMISAPWGVDSEDSSFLAVLESLGPPELYPLITALEVFGKLWPRSLLYAEDLCK